MVDLITGLLLVAVVIRAAWDSFVSWVWKAR